MENRNRIVSRLGDVDPIEYGGGVVFTDGKHRWLEFTHGREEEAFDDLAVEKLPVYQVDIEEDILDWHDWVDTEELSSYTGIDEEDLIRAATGSLAARAQLLADIGSYYGWYELDQQPLSFGAVELEERWRL
jgi:hypothetical protein